ncbi:MAG: efflux RND transporter periplasmic adaptor subunit [Alicyclobacillus sp.]|nr:efflux RND transporter periplasmic adaptor subunit [Alicyclobacillus sp.]
MRARQMILVNVVIFIVIVAAAIGGIWYFYNRQNYITENDAHIDAKMTYVVGLTPGKLVSWNLAQGQTVHAGDVIGREQLPTGQTIDVTAPASGEVLQNSAITGETVGQGTMLGAIADVQNEYVTAYVTETEVRHIKVGQAVDIYVDAYPGDSFSGTVMRIGNESAASKTVLPSGSATGTFTKEVQRIPVEISITGTGGKYIVPQMNATVRIHR